MHSSGSNFLAVQDEDQLYSIDAGTGVWTEIEDLEEYSKGLVTIGSDVYSLVSDSDELQKIDPADASTLESITITLAGVSINGGNGLAYDAANGILYAIIRQDNNQGPRHLTTLDPATGVATSIGILSDKFSSLAFDSTAETLYGITGKGADVPATLYSIDTTDASTTLVLAVTKDGMGEAIAYNATDGKLYRLTGMLLQAIDLGTLTIENVAAEGEGVGINFGIR